MPDFSVIGRARQDDVGAMRAAVAMRADIDDEGARRDVDLVGAEQEQHIERAGLRHLRRASMPPCARHEADIERADARGRGVQHREAVPAVLDGADRARGLRRQRERSRRRPAAPARPARR